MKRSYSLKVLKKSSAYKSLLQSPPVQSLSQDEEPLQVANKKPAHVKRHSRSLGRSSFSDSNSNPTANSSDQNPSVDPLVLSPEDEALFHTFLSGADSQKNKNSSPEPCDNDTTSGDSDIQYNLENLTDSINDITKIAELESRCFDYETQISLLQEELQLKNALSSSQSKETPSTDSPSSSNEVSPSRKRNFATRTKLKIPISPSSSTSSIPLAKSPQSSSVEDTSETEELFPLANVIEPVQNSPPVLFPSPFGPFKFVRFSSVKSCAVLRDQKARKYLQDAYVVVDAFGGNSKTGFFAVYDGHGGSQTASFAAVCLHTIFLQQLSGLTPCTHPTNDDPLDTFAKTFSIVNSQMKICGLDEDGCTATCCFITPDHLYVANVGDTEAILIRSKKRKPKTKKKKKSSSVQKHEFFEITTSHTPKLKSEESRILAAGGNIRSKHGEHRIFVPSIGFGLEVSRSLGDHLFKSVAPSIISEPDVLSIPLSEQDRFVVLATDGLWGAVSQDRVAQLVWNSKSAKHAAHSLMLEAKKSSDNTTVLVIDLNPFVTTPRSEEDPSV